MSWIQVALEKDVPDGEVVAGEAGDEPIAIYNLRGQIHVTHDTCTHQVASLSDGYVEGDCIECPLHQGRFHIPTGKAMGVPVTEDIRTYEVKVADGKVFVRLPE